jgi:hypothetical protein
MQGGFGPGKQMLPQQNWLKAEIRYLLIRDIFGTFSLQIDESRLQKRLVLRTSGKNGTLPFMVWSAGQREFVPLLLGLYWLLPPAAIGRRDSISWVIIEELEMGLHPKAIAAELLLVLELLSRGYRVCISTHSPQVLDLVWALNIIRKHKGSAQDLLDLFDAKQAPQMRKMADQILSKETKVYYFDRDNGKTVDISDLDPESDNLNVSRWGGLIDFSGRVGDVVARVVNHAFRRGDL